VSSLTTFSAISAHHSSKLYSSEAVDQTAPYLKKKQSSIIVAPNRKLRYRLVASFANEGGSKKSGIKNWDQISHFLAPCKN